MRETTEIAVIGAGVIGLTIALANSAPEAAHIRQHLDGLAGETG